MATHYQILGVPRNATQAEIKRAYRIRARSSHPDHNPHPEAARRFVVVKRAYEVLSHPARRRQYDLILDGVRVRRSKGTTAQTRPQPPKDDRKYGTRHRYTNPPPTRAEQEKRYRDTIQCYRLFTRKGMRLPRKEWWKRFDVVFREWGKARNGGFGVYSVIAPGSFAVYYFIRYGPAVTGVLWLLASLFFLRSSYRSAVRNIAERRKRNR